MEEIATESIKISADDAVDSMRVTKNMSNGISECPTADKYIKQMMEYSKYIKEEEKENWILTIKSRIYNVGERDFDDFDIKYELSLYEIVGQIMEDIENGKSWEEIREYTRLVAPDNSRISSIGQYMLQYSDKGIEFVDNVIGSHIKELRFLPLMYNEIKNKK